MSDQAVDTLKDVDVTFHGKNRSVTAVHTVSLTVNRGTLYGLVGYSGAGKSTLVRTINLLQRPTGGRLTVLGQDMLALAPATLRKTRKRIGNIFQTFNYILSRTLADNVAFPLKGIKSKQEIQKLVAQLLDLVGYTDRANAYPAQLSGGQKQRVGIARALASHPQIYISDTATSALDPKTTSSIHTLLQSLLKRLGHTLVLLTHQNTAVLQICNRVADMDAGAILQRGHLLQVFSHPKQQYTKDLLHTTLQLDQAIQAVMQQPAVKLLGANDRLLRLTYVGDSADKPLVAKLFTSYTDTANILFGHIQILQDTPFGNHIVVLSGAQTDVHAGITYHTQQDVKITTLLKLEA